MICFPCSLNGKASVQTHPQKPGVIVNWVLKAVTDQKGFKLHFQAEINKLLFQETQSCHIGFEQVENHFYLLTYYEGKWVQDRRIPICQWVLGLQATEVLGWIWENGRPKAILETWENNGKIITLYSSLADFLGARQWHFHGLGKQSERGKRDNQYFKNTFKYFKIRSPNMQMLQRLSFVEFLMVKGFCVCENAQVEE